MQNHHPKNERIKRKYFGYLEDAKRCLPKTVDQVAAALALFEQSTKWKDFVAFHIEQARAFKHSQYELTHPKTGKPLSTTTIHSRLMHCKAFFHWLAGQPGYKSRISYSDCEYFNPSANDTRVATAKREVAFPSLEQFDTVLKSMPYTTPIEKRDRAIMAFAILTGARDDAIASFSLRHVDLENRKVFQDGRDVRTKYRKTFDTWFFPVGINAESIFVDWFHYANTYLGFDPDDPLFPSTDVQPNGDGEFAASGLTRNHWKNASAIRRIFKQAFEGAGMRYYNPHLVRKTLGQLGEQVCTTPEEFKAWSQNLGHENVLTTLTSYGQVSSQRQAEIITSMEKKSIDDREPTGTPDHQTINFVLAHLQKQTLVQ